MKIDIGCGTKKEAGFVGIDSRAFEGVDHVLNAGTERWPFDDDSIEEARASHFVEHLTPSERVHFANELGRVLKKGGKALIITPHWASCRAYGDLTHQWPPVSEFWFYYLNAAWRTGNAPHNDQYTCDFDNAQGYNIHPALQVRAQEHVQFAIANYKEAAQDLICTLTKR